MVDCLRDGIDEGGGMSGLLVVLFERPLDDSISSFVLDWDFSNNLSVTTYWYEKTIINYIMRQSLLNNFNSNFIIDNHGNVHQRLPTNGIPVDWVERMSHDSKLVTW